VLTAARILQRAGLLGPSGDTPANVPPISKKKPHENAQNCEVSPAV
jgi:hypothetical protein